MRAGASDFLNKGRMDASLLGRSLRYAFERKRAELLLLAEKEYSENLIHSSLDMIIAVDMIHSITTFNKAASQTLGYDEDEVIGKSIDIFHAEPLDGLRLHKVTLIKKRYVGEVLKKKKDGNIFPAYLSASLLLDADGQAVGVISISRDVRLPL